MKTEIYEDYSAFLAREDKTLNGVTQQFADENPEWNKERYSEACWNCSGCSDCSGLKNAKPSENAMPEIPVVPNIHTRVLEAVKAPTNALEMGNWHTCETTHCRGGWVVTLAGKAGKELEAATTTEFAAMQIYKASSPIRISPVRFYETNAVEMADIERCAEEESKL